MTDAQHGEAPTSTLGTSAPRQHLYVILLLAVGVLMAVGGLIGGLVAKTSADQASRADSAPRRLSVGSDSGYLFPGPHAIVPDYTGLSIGIIVAVLGVIVLLAGIIVASAKSRVEF
jgi:hypothetical protein